MTWRRCTSKNWEGFDRELGLRDQEENQMNIWLCTTEKSIESVNG